MSDTMVAIGAAAGCFLVFGALAAAMGASAVSDWRTSADADDPAGKFMSLWQWWPTALAAAVAIGGPIAILVAA